jgi:hypothetical protein
MTVCYFYPIVLSVLISAKADGRFRIPNPEVMTDWAKWIGDVVSRDNILSTCVEGPITDSEVNCPNFMQQLLDPKLVAKTRGAISRKTPEKIYYILFLGLWNPLEGKAGKSSSKLELVVATSTYVSSINRSVCGCPD